jgi:nucleoside-diphosphate-sugar epimerase
LRDAGWQVSGTCRTVDGARRLCGEGIRAFVFDGERGLDGAYAALEGVSHVLSSVPPGARAEPALELHRRALEARGSMLRWLGYLSTTAVYGDTQGQWVDEHSPPHPGSLDGVQRLAAEGEWLSCGRSLGIPAQVFRLAAIYGPGPRSPLASVAAGRARRVVKPGQVFNRIHVDDLVEILAAAMGQASTEAVYNVADDEPAPADEVVAYAAELLGTEPPPAVPFEDADLPAFARSFYRECRRVANRRIKDALGVSLRYPSYREGLRSIASGAASFAVTPP